VGEDRRSWRLSGLRLARSFGSLNWKTLIGRLPFRASFDHALPTLAGLHTPEEDRWLFRERVFTACELWGYFDNQELVGIIAFREGWIDQLYVLPSSQGRGIGTALLQIAKSRCPGLSLWTFQRNGNARRFYERQGFTLVKETDGGRNEEKEPDALYFWSSGR
jgi:GNAT superfamily N-acetyltransferase